MDDNAEAYKFPSSKLSTELARLDEMGFTRSADLTIRASWPTETSEEIEVIERGRVEAAAGAFVGGRGVLADTSTIEVAVGKLQRALLEPAPTEGAKARLVALWTLIEPCLPERDIDGLRSAVLSKAFGEQEMALGGLNEGAEAQGGGH